MNRFTIFLLFSLLCSSLYAQTVSKGIQFLKSGKLDKAQEILEPHFDTLQSPDYTSLYYEAVLYSELYMENTSKTKYIERAIKAYEQLEKSPQKEQAYTSKVALKKDNLVNFLLKNAGFDYIKKAYLEAYHQYNYASQLRPNSEELKLNKAVCADNAKMEIEALKGYNELIMLNSNQELSVYLQTLFFNKSHSLLNQQQLDYLLKEGRRYYPNDISLLHYTSIHIDTTLTNYNDSLQTVYKEIIRLNPEDKVARFNLIVMYYNKAVLLDKADKYNQAVVAFKETESLIKELTDNYPLEELNPLKQNIAERIIYLEEQIKGYKR